MPLQVLVSTMNKTDDSLVTRMNLGSDAIIINQCTSLSARSWLHKGRRIWWYDFPERGVGISRNSALMRATGDILLFADDDVSYVDNYCQLVLKEFKRHPMADLIIFNVESTNPLRPEYQNHRFHRLHLFNSLRYGEIRIAVKRRSLLKRNIMFSILFGGGAAYGSGEDSLLLTECLKKGMKVYASPLKLGTVSHKESTWFCGYTRKFFYDKGALFACMSPLLAEVLCLQMCFRHREWFTSLTVKEGFSCMKEGIRDFRGQKAGKERKLGIEKKL